MRIPFRHHGRDGVVVVRVERITDGDGTGMPFLAVGYPASIYDAPCRNLNGARTLRWRADTFLTTVPLRSRVEPIRRLASFSWGYDELPVTIVPPAGTGEESWVRYLSLFRTEFPGWVWS